MSSIGRRSSEPRKREHRIDTSSVGRRTGAAPRRTMRTDSENATRLEIRQKDLNLCAAELNCRIQTYRMHNEVMNSLSQIRGGKDYDDSSHCLQQLHDDKRRATRVFLKRKTLVSSFSLCFLRSLTLFLVLFRPPYWFDLEMRADNGSWNRRCRVVVQRDVNQLPLSLHKRIHRGFSLRTSSRVRGAELE